MEKDQEVLVVKGGVEQVVALVAFAAGAYAGWQLAEGQHWAVRSIAAAGMGLGAGTAGHWIAK